MVSSCRNNGTISQELRYPFTGTVVQFWQESSLDEVVGEKGVKLSAGQRQRLNIIRGILIDKDVYFFDEPTSNLDKESEEKIVNMIDKYLKDKTYIIVTHRDSIKKLCNKHYVFEDHTMLEEK